MPAHFFRHRSMVVFGACLGAWLEGGTLLQAQLASNGVKQAHATRVSSGAIRIDGHLNEVAWRTAEPVTDFVQGEPVEGAAPTSPMEVRFAYGDTALYIGARMYEVGVIQAPLSRRDDGEQAEYVQIEVDTYHDQRTAYMFGVTAAGVRLDHYHPTDNQTDEDAGYDPVWQARTAVTEDGWTAELWLPFAQLRFNERGERIWGLNIKRHVPSRNEEVYWTLVRRTERGWSSRFGELRGVQDVEPRGRLELLPYVSGSSQVAARRDPKNPFDSGLSPGGRIGGDLKYGLGPNLTLEATVNTDFGQIDADPAEVNLTVFETIFSERRPFFLEGQNLFSVGVGNFYYSRRIGARPIGPAQGDFVDYPDTSTILGAAKLTGRLQSGTSIALLGALTDQEFARTSTGGLLSHVHVTPRTSWGIARVVQEIGGQGSVVGAHFTTVHRSLSKGDALASVVARDALTGGMDTRLRFGDRTYEVTANLGLTHVDGEPAAMTRIQTGSVHFFQRPDRPVLRLDKTRRSLFGAQINASFNKIAGRHWLWGGSLQFETPEFEPSDFGRLNFAGDNQHTLRLTYRETIPGRFFRAYSVATVLTRHSFFDRDLDTRYTVASNNSVTFGNFWTGTLNVARYLRGLDLQLTRGGPAMGSPRGWNVDATLRSRAGSQTGWSGAANIRSNELGDHTWSISSSVSFRPSPSVQFSVQPEYADEDGATGTNQGPINRQYLTALAGGRPETYGTRYIFGLVDRTTLTVQGRVSYTFRPDMTLDVYAEPFAASGRYAGFGELAAARGRDLRMYGQDGTTVERLPDGNYSVTDGGSTFALSNRDFNTRSFRSNVVLRWEWRPGSILYVVWQQNRASTAPEGGHVGLGDLFGSLSAPGDNILAVKTTLWMSR